MSVSPTEDALIVALDFEGEIKCVTPSEFTVTSYPRTTGVHSLERSAQEDMLLVLFNTAISNLVSNTSPCHYYIINLTVIIGSIS